MRLLPGNALGALVTSACASLVIAGAPSGGKAQQLQTVSDTTASVGSKSSSGPSHADSLSATVAPSPFAGWVITPDSIDPAPLTGMSDMLQARVPGLAVRHISGTTGSAASIRLRGTRSTVLSSTPLVLVDGLRVDMGAPLWPNVWGSTLVRADAWASRLDDLDPEDVDRVEVLGGAAAASRFGRGAAGGVIAITTKHGTHDGLRWNVRSAFGTVDQATSFPTSYDQRGITSNGTHIHYCGVVEQAKHDCSTIPDSLLTSNALEQHSPFRTGTRSQIGVSGSIGGDDASAYVAGGVTRENGPLYFNHMRRDHVLASARAQPFQSLEISARAGYTRGHLSGTEPGSIWDFFSGMAGGPDRPQGYRIPPDSIAQSVQLRRTGRFIASATTTWKPIGWLSVTGTLGTDRDRMNGDITPPSSDQGWFDQKRTVYKADLSTARVEASMGWRLGGGLHLGASSGFEKLKHNDRGRTESRSGSPLLPELRGYDEFRVRDRLESRFGRLELSWNDRILLAGGLRREEISVASRSATYPSVGAAWRMSSEHWFPHDGIVSELTLRAAYGEAGQARTPLNTEYFFAPGKPDASEKEVGVDVVALDRRVTLGVAYYRGRNDAWSVGYPGTLYTPAVLYQQSVHSRGLEAALSAAVLERGPLRVRLDATAAFPRTRYAGHPLFFAQERLTPGYPVGG